ncbi:hypothetical protein [Prescottella subtropica]|uniref:hypothetical protein n=1 Tax=Prescottella subtropica TaxID=2545757 RepID=UPI001F4F4F62|nr:hypothetical protein [Prescottella subtropica]
MGQSSFLKDQAKDENYRLAGELEKTDLFFELNFDEDAIRRAQELFGRIAHAELRIATHEMVIKKYPALTLVSLIGHAGVEYDQGRFWESYWEVIGLDPDSEFEAALRHSLRDLLAKYRMREFPELLIGNKYVMVMALHAGIPVNCLSDLVDVIHDHVHQGRDTTGAAVLEWLLEPGMGYRLNRVDVPVRNFLQLAGEIAVDILDRIVEFLLFTLEHPDPWNDLTLETSTTGLPTLLLDGLIDRLRDRPFGQAADAGVRGPRRRRPVISYSVEDDQVMVGVPYPTCSQGTPWKVTIAGTTRDVYAERGWGVDADGEHPHTPIAVTAPAREVLMTHDASDENYRIAVVDTTDPMLLFTEDGRLIKSSALPRGLVLAVHPKDGTVVDAVTGTELESDGDTRVPSGWRGWHARFLDLTEHNSIQFRRAGRPNGTIRGVRSVGAPRFEPGDPVVGLRTPNGLPVCSERPEIVLPPHIGSEPVTWRVRARQAGDRSWLSDAEWDSDTEEASLDPFDGVPAGLLGSYDIHISGPMGSGQWHTVFLAEGIDLDHGVAFRRPTANGLTASTVEITCPAPLSVDRDRITFAEDERDSHIRVSAGGHAYKLVVTPPHFEARVDVLGAPAQWRTSTQVLAPADLEQNAVVAARIPGDVRVSLALIDAAGETVQDEYPDTPADNVFQLDARRFVDTARRVGSCRLVALVDDATGTHTVTIAHIRPARLCENIHLDGGDLVFTGLADEDDLAAWVWAATAPWRPVTRLDIDGDRTALPETLRDAGELIVQVFVDDPWVTVTRPTSPDRSAVRVAQHGWVRDENAAVDALACFLAGHGSAPLTPDAVPGAWAALALMDAATADSDTERVRGGLIRILGRNPRAALEALGSSTIPQEKKMALLIRTQLVNLPYSARDTHNELHPDPWVGCMVEISDLPSLHARRTVVAAERAETLAYLENQGGGALMELLRVGKLQAPLTGVFNEVVLRMDAMSAEQTQELFEAVQLVPGALLDEDTRTSAVADAFHLRSSWVQDPACAELSGHVGRALRQVKAVAPGLYDLVEARNEALHGVDVVEYPWMLLSMQSLTLAAVARLDSRGEFEHSPMTHDMRTAWARMAEYFPAMVANDLLIADALATYRAHNDLIGENA